MANDDPQSMTDKLRQVFRWSRWSLTPLGTALLAVVTTLILLAGFSLYRSFDDGMIQKQAANQESTNPAVNRTFSTADAVDFAQLSFDTYIASVTAEGSASEAAGPPYDLTIMLNRLELIRPKLSSNLHKKLRASYTRSASVATITRDEVLCGKSDVTEVVASLRLGGQDLAVVSVEKRLSGKTTGVLEATVDLKARVLTEINCK